MKMNIKVDIFNSGGAQELFIFEHPHKTRKSNRFPLVVQEEIIKRLMEDPTTEIKICRDDFLNGSLVWTKDTESCSSQRA